MGPQGQLEHGVLILAQRGVFGDALCRISDNFPRNPHFAGRVFRQVGVFDVAAFLTVLVLGIWPLTATAQDAVYVQVEAQPTLSGAQARARVYAGQIKI